MASIVAGMLYVKKTLKIMRTISGFYSLEYEVTIKASVMNLHLQIHLVRQ